MDDFNTLQQLLDFRSEIDEDEYDYDEIVEKEAEIFCNNVENELAFIEQKCTDIELWWLSEAFWDIVEKSQSQQFFETVIQRAIKIKDKNIKAGVLFDIESAKDALQ